jgi:dihydroorotase
VAEPSPPEGPGPADARRTPSTQRRRLLIAGAYTAVSAVVLNRLPHHRGHAATLGSRGSSEPPATTEAARGSEHRTQPPDLAGAAAQPGPDHVYDVILTGGRVIDPESGFDGVLDVGIDGGTITGFGPTVQHGKQTIDAKKLVVSPGFIDVLSYEPNTRGAWYKIGDGVTTNLGMHGMQDGWWAESFFSTYTGSCPVNFGGAFGDHWVRYHKLGLGAGQAASADQISQLADILEEQLHQGWLGVDFEPEYTPGVNFDEMLGLAKVAQRYDVPCFVHGRYSSKADESKTVPEIIRLGEESGAAVHVAHLPSTGGTWDIDAALDEIDKAHDAGHDVTFGLYPYNYWGTYAASARFDPGWQERFGITYHDLQVAGTPNRLDASTFAAAQAANSLTVAYAIPERSVRKALQHPRSIIGSDAIVDSTNNHPRASGCFSRVLGHYVREEKVLSLVDALAKMTILPAKRLEKRSPQLAHKGRVQRGADADLCLFDPETVTDRSTVAHPIEYSGGIDYVLLGGIVVKDRNGSRTSELHGQPIRSVLT